MKRNCNSDHTTLTAASPESTCLISRCCQSGANQPPPQKNSTQTQCQQVKTVRGISFGPSQMPPWPSYNHNHPFEADMTGVCDSKVAPNSSNRANTTFQHFTEVSLFKSAGDLQGNLYLFCVCFFFRYIISTSTSVHLLVEKVKIIQSVGSNL